ncbi:hypothetical protein Pmar_PMAR004723 [Perkinsus marinus ATCC 50983]|uniref:CCHC-type domain-containing protein n=1 Tax=Perkinsus marinus (strain ATCC 50983 / TXsc) TaxID=423536 RepID=C5KF69_PERM5|nr:hypothetical protein Pmar_PMAR004723 [Perkinsus marinus ATCC 50983]EER16871.1 hypothetical protein Pmar_PMAR004723 [Perkinsus marinus ATCC 50983]|eukprot:XP_002785075.1 hypothetical protein Pmar_PMAR004723 [Perkinsus marinus ATCC 50983]
MAGDNVNNNSDTDHDGTIPRDEVDPPVVNINAPSATSSTNNDAMINVASTGPSAQTGATTSTSTTNNFSAMPNIQTTSSTSSPVVVSTASSESILPARTKRLFVPVPEKFANKPTDNIRDWFEAYELYTYGNLYDDRARARFLGAFLTGDSANVWKTQCSKVNYEADKAILIKTFEKCRLPDEAWSRFDNYQWDRIQPLSVYAAALSRYLNEYNDLLKPDCRLSLPARETLLVEKLSKLATGAAKAEIRRARPRSAADVCDLLGAYVDNSDQTGINAVRSIEPKLDASIEMLSKLLGAFEGAQSRQVEQFDRLCAVLGNPQPKGQPNGQAVQNGQQRRRGVRRCGICSGPHLTLECFHKKFTVGCAICGNTEHFARNCPLRTTFLAGLQGNPPSPPGN